MPYVTCTFCGKSGIQALDIGICSTCLKRDDDRIRILAIKKYLELYPHATMKDISKELGIKMEILDRLIAEGSLIVMYDDNGEMRIANEKEEENPQEKKRKQFMEEMSAYRTTQNVNRTAPNIGKSKLVKDLNNIYRNNHGER